MSQDNSHHHILPLSVYLTIGSILIVLTGVTVYVASIDFGAYNLVIAMVIAGFKASLVALYFMHLKYDNKLYMITFLGALLFLAIFVIFTMFDTLRRDDIYEIKSGPIQSDAVIYRDQPASVPDSLVADSLSEGLTEDSAMVSAGAMDSVPQTDTDTGKTDE